jgi:hypothetical protein
VTPALWLLVALQSASPPDLTAQVDRARVPAGEELTLTIRARSRSAEPVAVALPGLSGFIIVGSREVTEVSLEGVGGPIRTMTRELRLKTQHPGTLVIGPVRVRQGSLENATPPLTVTVDSAVTGLATAVSPPPFLRTSIRSPRASRSASSAASNFATVARSPKLAMRM